jgi:hypothetical protein
MKDHSDKDTKDIFTNSAMVGRPRQYVTNADKQRAYRARKNQATPRKSKRSSMNIQPLQLMSKTFNVIDLNPVFPQLANLGDMRVVSLILNEGGDFEVGFCRVEYTDTEECNYYRLSDLQLNPPVSTNLAEMVDQKPLFDPYLDSSVGKDFIEPELDEALLSASFIRRQSQASN